MTPKRRSLSVLATLGAIAFAFSCASGQLDTVQNDGFSKLFLPPEDAALGRVYVVRPPGFVASGIVVQVVVDGTLAGAIGVNQFLAVDVAAGRHTFAYLETSQQKSATLDVRAGGLHFLEVRLPSEEIVVLVEPEGKRKVLAARRVERF